ncbi:hypothetical protein F511_38269 [Dorcoceras hygrometricum]|uniref:Uncharacterized protein n=1 Tax=Dorcoceras hygrometricum TaxID=472368 RepID=A0A2Z7D4E0_9LAMI|nr:hypothetical protein F511_38269 [Dorcoceras hygrometricum]
MCSRSLGYKSTLSTSEAIRLSHMQYQQHKSSGSTQLVSFSSLRGGSYPLVLMATQSRSGESRVREPADNPHFIFKNGLLVVLSIIIENGFQGIQAQHDIKERYAEFVYGSSELNLLRLPFFRHGKDPLEDFDYNDPRCNPLLRPAAARTPSIYHCTPARKLCD